jgi:TRAP-type C4-dicarboxylate transport system permease small subunit
MDKLSKALKTFEEVSILFFVSIILAITFIDVFLRYMFNKSLTWGEELSRFLFVMTTYIGASAGVRMKGHIVVDLILQLFPKSKKTIKLISYILAVLFSLIISITSIKVAFFLKSIGQVSTGLSLPMWIPYFGVFLGSLMMSFRFVEVFLKTVQNKDGEVL